MKDSSDSVALNDFKKIIDCHAKSKVLSRNDEQQKRFQRKIPQNLAMTAIAQDSTQKSQNLMIATF